MRFRDWRNTDWRTRQTTGTLQIRRTSIPLQCQRADHRLRCTQCRLRRPAATDNVSGTLFANGGSGPPSGSRQDRLPRTGFWRQYSAAWSDRCHHGRSQTDRRRAGSDKGMSHLSGHDPSRLCDLSALRLHICAAGKTEARSESDRSRHSVGPVRR